MSLIRVQCPDCGTSGSIEEESAQKTNGKIKCPKCSIIFSISAEESDEALKEESIPPETNAQPDPTDSGSDLSSEVAQSLAMEDQEQEKDSGELDSDPAPSQIPPEPPQKVTDKPSLSKLSFHGNGGSLFGIQFVNFLLGIVTLGFYRFWGKAKVRKYLYSQVELMDDRFTYFGTGKELFIGWLKGMGIIILGYIVITGLQMLHPVFIGIAYIAFLALLGFAKVGCARYRLSRSSWRGIGYSFRGTFKEGIWLHVWGNLAVFLSLGLFYPFLQTKLRGFWFNNSYFGNSRFSYSGNGKDLFVPYLLALVLALLTLGISFFWFMARFERYHWKHTTFPGMKFESTVTGGALCKLIVVNVLIFIFTIGIATPWIITRTMDFRCKYLTLKGELEFDKISQDAKASQAAGEGVADYLDIDGGIMDFGII